MQHNSTAMKYWGASNSSTVEMVCIDGANGSEVNENSLRVKLGQ